MSKFLMVSPGNLKTIAQSSNPVIADIAAFPVGLAYVSGSMKAAGIDPITLNSSFLKSDLRETLQDIISNNEIGAVCTGGTAIDVHEIKNIIEIVRHIDSSITVIAGGAIISSDPHTAMSVLGADVGIIGEGEETMHELCSVLESHASVSSVAGIIYRDGEVLRRTPARAVISDIDNLPYMDFDGWSYDEWLALNNHAGIIHSARSCPFRCTFCFKSTGSIYRQRSLDSVFREIDHQIARYNIKSLMMTDELFASNKRRVLEFCERIRNYNINWGASLRVAEIDEELLRVMKNSGCIGIGTGLESAAPEILSSMRKSVTAEQMENALNVFASSEINMLGNFIFGDVCETKDTINTTIDLWRKHNEHVYINLGIVATYPGTQIYEIACKKNLIKDKERYLTEGNFVMNITGMSDQEYFQMVSRVTELGFLPQVPSATVRIQNFNDDGICEVSWQCRKCNQENDLLETHFLQAPICTCSCGIQNTVEPFRALTCDREQLFEAIPADETIVFWGVGSQYCRLARFHDGFDSPRIIQVDANEHQQKMTRLGKKIYSPDIISENNLKNVVITSPVAKNSIIRAIDSNYPCVVNVYFPSLHRVQDKLVPVFQHITQNV